MDEPDLDARLHRQALAGLARLNAFGRSSAMIWRALQPFRNQRLRILDIACGGGDVAISLARRARRRGYAWEFTGVDKSELALDVARDRAKRAGVTIDFQACDVLADDLPPGFDIITCSLFLHHLSEGDAIQLLRRAGQAAGQMVVVSDLRRSRTNEWLTYFGCQLLSRSPVVHKDGPISIRAAFTMEEAVALAREAGLTDVCIKPRFPVRWLLTWRRP
jgi:2-polyprenyl-3-methyl-5-hydroxy-6-metoxy-1,4-benzoquinol methylase